MPLLNALHQIPHCKMGISKVPTLKGYCKDEMVTICKVPQCSDPLMLSKAPFRNFECQEWDARSLDLTLLLGSEQLLTKKFACFPFLYGVQDIV